VEVVVVPVDVEVVVGVTVKVVVVEDSWAFDAEAEIAVNARKTTPMLAANTKCLN